MKLDTQDVIFGTLWLLLASSVASIVAGIWLNDYRWVASGLVVGTSAMITVMALTL